MADAPQPRMVNCVKLGRTAEGLSRPPFKNELGQRIYENVSQEAWQSWIAHSTMIINENRLELGTKKATDLLLSECEKFFFGEGSAKPEGYVPPKP